MRSSKKNGPGVGAGWRARGRAVTPSSDPGRDAPRPPTPPVTALPRNPRSTRNLYREPVRFSKNDKCNLSKKNVKNISFHLLTYSGRITSVIRWEGKGWEGKLGVCGQSTLYAHYRN